MLEVTSSRNGETEKIISQCKEEIEAHKKAKEALVE